MTTTSSAQQFEIGGQRVAPGTRAVVRLPVTTSLNGTTLGVTVHVVHGARRGPVLGLLSVLHGGEWFSIETFRRVVQGTDPMNLTGTILAIPVANPPALALNTRNMPDECDSPDANRIFPGPLAWTSDQIIATITREVVERSTHLMDYHMGPWGSSFHDIIIGADLPNAECAAESERLALAYGTSIVRTANVMSGFPGPRSSIGYAAGVLGKPTLGIEVGGLGFGPAVENAWQERAVAGTRAVMGALGMIDDPPDPRPARQLLYRQSHRVNPTKGGMLRSFKGPDAITKPVKRGDLLGEVYSPYTFEVIEQLRAPADGLLFYVSRDYPVHPGDWAFGVANTEDPGVRWVDNAGVRS